MTTCPMPHIAAELDPRSGVHYLAESTLPGQPDEHLAVWLPEPRLPAGAEELYRWVEDDSRVTARHVQLDSVSMAMLLYIADGEPLDLDDAAALDAIDHSLTEVRCYMLRCTTRVYSSDFDGPRWSHCELRAARLVGTEA
jgi:hypothetical protein